MQKVFKASVVVGLVVAAVVIAARVAAVAWNCAHNSNMKSYLDSVRVSSVRFGLGFRRAFN